MRIHQSVLRVSWIALCVGILPLVVSATPRIVVDEPTFDFGEQMNNQTIEHTFVLRNEGDSVLEITNIRSTCGCTVGEVTSRSIPPGETSGITASYNLRGRQGRQRSILTVETNDPNSPQTRLTMGGVAVRDLTVRPTTVVFGQVTEGQRVLRQVEVIGLPDQSFEIAAVHVESEDFAVIEREELAPHHYRFTVEATPRGQAGHRQGVLRIETTHAQHAVIQIPVHAELAGALSIAPHTITLMGGNDRPVTRYIVIRPGAVRDFEVTDVVAPVEDIRVNVLSLPNNSYRIQLMNIVATDDLIGQSIRIRTNVEGMDDLAIPFEILEPTS